MSANLEDTRNIIEILINLQPFLRKPIIKNKLNRFCFEDPKLQEETISIILEIFPKYKNIELPNLIKTWLESLFELESKKISLIIEKYFDQFIRNPDIINNIDSTQIMNIFNSLDPTIQKQLAIYFLETCFLINKKSTLIKIIPNNIIDFLIKKLD